MRTFPVKMPSGTRYWTVIGDDLLVMSEADAYLRHLRFGRDAAESTTRTYAGAIALYLSWCAATGQDWRAAAEKMPSFVLWLRHCSLHGTAGGSATTTVRGPRRINCVLAGVRGFLIFAVDHNDAPRAVLAHLYELANSQDLPAEARGEDGVWRLRLRARHRVPAINRRPDRASDDDFLALLRACLSARDRLLVILLARAGLRRGELVGLRREDVHFLLDSSSLGCNFPGAHLHVVRRQNINGAWAKSRHSRIVPVDSLVVQAHDQYFTERARNDAARESDFVFVNLFRAPIGAPMTPAAVNELLAAASHRAELNPAVHPHALRHGFASNVLDAGGSIDEVQELLGHASISSSQVYLHPAPRRLRAAVERVAHHPTPASR
ncbi:tyrosine-type recombinase/integrase [Arthrobacter sp. efr-133-R2A-120]|uniref:tyrosine-type recombinase/integrase n=1 Tax=Arthrobacter sp. efr-133-R2A-120 TaxID=3040277 RepID=UPI00254CCB55|nr:tyrosine-type recombinase/integrase [Arthrobacter sp. efr-133-R2A-120]